MHVRCPHCQNPIELVEESKLSDVSCPSCGSIFSLLADVETLTHAGINERTIGHFQLIEQVGIGAFGSVWKARDTELDRTVAIKIPRKGQLDAAETEQFLREARSAAQLKHPGIVAVHEVGREDGQVYIVSDFIQGINLKNWLSQQRLTTREAAEMCVKIAETLHHAHEQGVIHRDVKPSNIVLDVNNEPHVMDFGLAKREAGEITMTIDGQVLGTPTYMSPEQARGGGHQADRRTDIYSLGVILYELLTGELPFRGDREMLIYQILRDEPISPRRINSHLPRDLETICLKCLRKELQHRYATAEELGRDLKRWLNSEPIVARPVSRIEKAWLWCCRNRAISGSTGAICVAAAIMVFILIAHRIENDRKRAEFLVDAVLSAPAEAVPYAIQNLEPLREYAIPILQKRLEDDAAEPAHRLHATVALAEFGLV